MSGCLQYEALLKVLAYNFKPKEISALFSNAGKSLVNILSEVTENLCCVQGVLSESQRKELSKYRSIIRIVSCRKQSVKNRRKC